MPAEVQPREGWRTYRFDEIATNVNERVDDPSEAGVEHYVGLEHLDSDSPTIRRWGSPTDVQATKLRFRKGDIIFGRRRVYQRKLGVAHFDGICSAHAMVLRPKPGVVLPELLPFFMQSDLFMARAKEISVGSLSPTINWPALAREEFPLPPLDEQRRIARILSCSQEVVDTLEHALVACRPMVNSGCDSLILGRLSALPLELSEGLDTTAWRETSLGDVVTLGNGHGFRPPDWSDRGLPIIRIQNVRGSHEFNYYAGTPKPEWIVEPGELLFSWAGVPGVSFGPGIWNGPRGVLNQHIFRVTPRRGVEVRWLYEVLRHVTPRIESRAHGFKHNLVHIRRIEFTSIRVLLPPERQQNLVVGRIERMRQAELILERRQQEAARLRRDLLARSLGGM
jgi:type I restriction enzyme, S subunit